MLVKVMEKAEEIRFEGRAKRWQYKLPRSTQWYELYRKIFAYKSRCSFFRQIFYSTYL